MVFEKTPVPQNVREVFLVSRIIKSLAGHRLLSWRGTRGSALGRHERREKIQTQPLQAASCEIHRFHPARFRQRQVGPYDDANREMLDFYKRSNDPDGEICFLAANKDLDMKGIGTALLGELAKRKKGKEIYLFTDTGCTYQFYEHRGFERVGQKDVVLGINGNRTDLTRLLCRKKL